MIVKYDAIKLWPMKNMSLIMLIEVFIKVAPFQFYGFYTKHVFPRETMVFH